MNVIIDGVRYIPAPAPCENPELLDFVFHCTDLEREVSIREYLGELLKALWDEGEGFSSKSPFGNSGWEYSLYGALIKAGAVEGRLDEYNGRFCVDHISGTEQGKANQIVFSLIAKMCGLPS
ncbi:hypothetical protein [Burkholderia sp. Ac-20349]|uniref:hypothetical protein n=1 Tax=Burkholderia sp. Ac-20349 TaxID=2703893 RepID=UPI00197B6A98|nr:hypothetical protein [Burkholderia sp. Ac-20349]MBN3839304.1 hypothetical protein [Burkholderia sp. Ac-20349]